MYKESIGLVGGFGGYATLNFFRRILEEFATGKERDYPHIFMDNNFTMPSRTKALLTGGGVEYDEIVSEIVDSLKKLGESNRCGADHIIMVCGTAHGFLPDVYKVYPEIKDKLLNIIEITKEYLIEENIEEVLILAAEGTLKQRVYQKYFDIVNIKINAPIEAEYSQIREFIEAVKQNEIDLAITKKFDSFLKKYKCENVILGCTEFPVLIKAIKDDNLDYMINQYNFIDPLELTIQKLKKILK